MRRSVRAAVVAASLLLAIGLSGVALAACGGSATADAQTQAAPSALPQPDPSGLPQLNGQMGDPSAMLKALLNTLVAKDIITSSQADAVAAALGAAMEQLRPPTADASPGAQPTPGGQPSPGVRAPDPSTMFSSALDLLVKAGVITNAQKTAIVDALGAATGGPPGASQPAGDSSTQTS